MSFLPDTDTCSAYLKGSNALANRFIQYGGRLHLSAASLGELYTWAFRARASSTRMQRLLDMLPLVSLLVVDAHVARRFGELDAYLLDHGLAVSEIDLQNAATALVHLPQSTITAKGELIVDFVRPRFDLGQTVATPAALKALDKAGQSPAELLDRHIVGDWGDLSDDDKQANEDALVDGSRILSAYHLRSGCKIWIITEASNGLITARSLVFVDQQQQHHYQQKKRTAPSRSLPPLTPSLAAAQQRRPATPAVAALPPAFPALPVPPWPGLGPSSPPGKRAVSRLAGTALLGRLGFHGCYFRFRVCRERLVPPGGCCLRSVWFGPRTTDEATRARCTIGCTAPNGENSIRPENAAKHGISAHSSAG